ncbi:hypothetical protein NDU88_001669 [Pleurodeles waltl]|uniref:Uncharacterized protein n=1 Tax=Pleurodeles waltl TaxID=8319 RepID=A0AAV7T168_PLEWA|nr:hypothetical protein NDU88_001669 [Pleurodeles waltl]
MPNGAFAHTHLLVEWPRYFQPIRSVREPRTQALNPGAKGVRKNVRGAALHIFMERTEVERPKKGKEGM